MRVVVASKPFGESYLLGEMFAQVLESRGIDCSRLRVSGNAHLILPYHQLIDRVTERAFQKGLLLLGCGKSAFRLAPPLILNEYDVDTGMAILESCLSEEK